MPLFEGVDAGQWNDWRWQLRNSVHDAGTLSRFMWLSLSEHAMIANASACFPVAVTPYILSLMNPDDPCCPLRLQFVPRARELESGECEREDPLCEESDSPVPGLVHRYPDRVLLLVTTVCAVYCRYCTRRRIVGGVAHFGRNYMGRALKYIAEHPEIKDVIVSGGDPFMLSDGKIAGVLKRIREIEHVEIIRVGTRVPAVLPQRVTPRLAAILGRYQPLYVVTQFNHSVEITHESRHACALMADAGIPLSNQTVLLKGVNDEIDVMRRLSRDLLLMRVRPYYLHQCDLARGTAHFRVPIDAGLELMRGMRGHMSGLGVPTYMLDPPGCGKVPLQPEYVIGRSERELRVRGYSGKTFGYPLD